MILFKYTFEFSSSAIDWMKFKLLHYSTPSSEALFTNGLAEPAWMSYYNLNKGYDVITHPCLTFPQVMVCCLMAPPMLTYHQLGPVTFIWGYYHKIPFSKARLTIAFLKSRPDLMWTNVLTLISAVNYNLECYSYFSFYDTPAVDRVQPLAYYWSAGRHTPPITQCW